MEKCDVFETLGTSCPVTQYRISENLVPKVHASFAGHREALLSSDDAITWLPRFVGLTPPILATYRVFIQGGLVPIYSIVAPDASNEVFSLHWTGR